MHASVSANCMKEMVHWASDIGMSVLPFLFLFPIYPVGWRREYAKASSLKPR